MKHEDQNPTDDEERLARQIRVGIGGWSYEPWRQTFYPKDLPQKRELHYASRHVSAIEINSTFYRLQTPSVFAKWRDDTPNGFVFSIKAPRYIVQRRTLASAREALDRFLSSGIDELGTKLGPILWQLPPQKTFDREDVERFLRMLPRSIGAIGLRHALEVRHESFRCEQFVEIARRYGVATVYTHSHEYPAIADVTGDFVYARLRESAASEPTGYAREALAAWAIRARRWADGESVLDLPLIAEPVAASKRDVFVYIHQRRKGTRAGRGDGPSLSSSLVELKQRGAHTSIFGAKRTDCRPIATYTRSVNYIRL